MGTSESFRSNDTESEAGSEVGEANAKPEGTEVAVRSADRGAGLGLSEAARNDDERQHGNPVVTCLLSERTPRRPQGSSTLPIKKTITAKLVEVYFRNDHAVGDPNTKLLKPSPGDFKDATSTFMKPEWNNAGKNDPVSMTKGSDVFVDLVIEFTVEPKGQTAKLTEIRGAGSHSFMFRRKDLNDTVKTERKIIYWLQSENKLKDSVHRLDDEIHWAVYVDGQRIELGATGPHTIYVTWATPSGKLQVPNPQKKNCDFNETGSDQDVTQERLNFSVSGASGQTTEKGCIDALFKSLGVHYQNGGFLTTGLGLSQHHYLWKTITPKGLPGECHMLAGGFLLACKMLGVQGSLEVGYMYPWGRRDGSKPYNPRAKPVHGKYNAPELRNHSLTHWLHPDVLHGDERLCFIDKNGKQNLFEAVVAYQGNILYAIGEEILDKFSTADENADAWFKEPLERGVFKLYFDGMGGPACLRPYPPAVEVKNDEEEKDYAKRGKPYSFKWND